jgi:hypothetical protein
MAVRNSSILKFSYFALICVALLGTLRIAVDNFKSATPQFGQAPLETYTQTTEMKIECETEAQMRSRLSGYAADVTFQVLDVEHYLPLFDALPPATHTSPVTKLISATSPDQPQVLLFGFVIDCLKSQGRLSKKAHANILQVLGEGI